MNETMLLDLVEDQFIRKMRNTCKQDISLIAIDNLDLKMVKMKLTLPIEEDGKGWSTKVTEKAEAQYKMFLKLHILYPGKSIVPTKTIDEMWHAHILDTRAYHEDSKNIFGRYLHHFPYFGLRGKEDAQDLKDSFEETIELFKKEFGEDLHATSSDCRQCNTGGQCRTGGSKCW